MAGWCPTSAPCNLTVYLLCCVQANKNGSSGERAPPVVGFCFSFALEQQALNSGKLLVWTKGFNVEGVIGKDVVALLSGQACADCAASLPGCLPTAGSSCMHWHLQWCKCRSVCFAVSCVG